MMNNKKTNPKEIIKNNLLAELELNSSRSDYTDITSNLISDSDLLIFGYLKKKCSILPDVFKENFFDSPSDGGVDIIIRDENILIQTKTKKKQPLKMDDLMIIINKLDHLLLNGYNKIKKNYLGEGNINDNVFDALINLNWNEPIKFIISAKKIAKDKETEKNILIQLKKYILSSMEEQINNYKMPLEIFQNIEIELIEWEEIYDLFEKNLIPKAKFYIDSQNILYNKNPNLNNNYLTGIVLNMSILNLYELYDKFNNKLFELNVRNFTKSNSSFSISNIVNQDISRTLENNSDLMWFMNNGIVILCDNFIILKNNELELTNFSIINGAQTVTNIFNFLKPKYDKFEENKEVIYKFMNISIIAKIIKRNESDKVNEHSFKVPILNKEITDFSKELVRTTNNQKPISSWTFFYNDPLVLEIKNYLDSKKKYFLLNKEAFIEKSKIKKYGKDKILDLPTYTQIGKAVFNLTPGLAIQRKNKLFKSSDSNNDQEFKKTLEIITKNLEINSSAPFLVKIWFDNNIKIGKWNIEEIKQIKRFRIWIYSILSFFSLIPKSLDEIKLIIDLSTEEDFEVKFKSFLKNNAEWDFNQLNSKEKKKRINEIIQKLINDVILATDDNPSKLVENKNLYKDTNFMEFVKLIIAEKLL